MLDSMPTTEMSTLLLKLVALDDLAALKRQVEDDDSLLQPLVSLLFSFQW